MDDARNVVHFVYVYSTSLQWLFLFNFWKLGMQEVICNFWKLTMQFSINGRERKLDGVGSNGVTICSVWKRNRLLQHVHQLSSAQLRGINLAYTYVSPFSLKLVCTKLNGTIRQLFDELSYVFCILVSLPLSIIVITNMY